MKPDNAPSVWLPPFALGDLPDPPPGKTGWPWTEAPEPLAETAPGGREWPPLGIVAPSFNQADYVEASIRSVLLQGYPRLEYYFEDGGSTDGTLDVVRKYAPFLSGWTSESDRGQSHAINKAMARLQKAEWVTWLNTDDLLMPGALKAIGQWAAGEPEAVAVVGRGRIVEEARGGEFVTQPKPDLDGIKLRNWKTHAFLQPTCFFSKSAFDAVGGVSESLHYAMDFDLWVKLGEIGRFERIDEMVAVEIRHENAKTFANMGEAVAEAVQVLFERGHAEDGRRLIRTIYDELNYMNRLLRPVTENRIYRKFVRPWLRRRHGPKHLKDQA